MDVWVGGWVGGTGRMDGVERREDCVRFSPLNLNIYGSDELNWSQTSGLNTDDEFITDGHFH